MPDKKNKIERLEIKDDVLLYLDNNGETLAAIEFEEGEQFPYVVYYYNSKGVKGFIIGYENLGNAIQDVLKIK